eukprot:6821313-Heterocapsa_arctica.AAC.1
MSEALKTRLLHRKDIFYQVEDNGEIVIGKILLTWQLITELKHTSEILGGWTGKKSVESCAISAQRIRHRAPAPRKCVTLRDTKNGLDEGRWENAEFGTSTRQSCTGSSSTSRTRDLREHEGHGHAVGNA